MFAIREITHRLSPLNKKVFKSGLSSYFWAGQLLTRNIYSLHIVLVRDRQVRQALYFKR